MAATGWDHARDATIEALAALAMGAVNAGLQDQLGQEAIRYAFGAPLPLNLLSMNALPALTIYRLEDRDRDKGDWLFEDVTTYRLDYIAPATPLQRLDKRWPILRSVWTLMLAAFRHGTHPAVADGQPIESMGRYVLGSGRAQYVLVPGASDPYPAFRATVQIEGCYEPTPQWDGSWLTDFDELWTKWNLQPETNFVFEAEDKIRPNG